jgi:lysophospholipase L1-like esterase
MIERLVYFIILLYVGISSAKAQPTVINRGIPGNSSRDLLTRIDAEVTSAEPDVAIVLIGTNDMVNSKKMISYGEFTSNCRTIIEKLKSRQISVIFMSPPPVDTAYLFQRHDRNLFPELPNAKLDSISVILAGLAKEYRAHFIDINKVFREHAAANPGASSLIINEKNSGKKDGVHPTREGYYLIALEVHKLLQEKRLLKNSTRIVCIGDSITFGSFMEGAGTSHGNTYPAILKSMITKK